MSHHFVYRGNDDNSMSIDDEGSGTCKPASTKGIGMEVAMS